MLHDSYTVFALGRLTAFYDITTPLERAAMACRFGWCETFVMVIDSNFDMRFADELEIARGVVNCGRPRKVVKLPDSDQLMLIA